MKGKWMTLVAGIMTLMMILLADHQPAAATPPTGELKTVAPSFGNMIPIPRLESAHANDCMQLLYDHVIGCTPDGKLSPDRGLANKWEMSRDGLTWMFYLRKGIKFHDGVELTAKDVKFTLEQGMLPDSLSGESPFLRAKVKTIEVKDPYTVVIHCKEPDIFLPNLLSNLESAIGMVVPKDYYEKAGKDGFANRPIGSGPYKWHSQMSGSFIKLEATEKHWRDGVPKYKYMTYLVIPEESTRMAMLKAGEADISRISRGALKDALSAGLNVMTKQNASVIVFQANMQWTSPVFSDIRFRKAINLAIDKEAIIKHIFSGMADPIAAYPGSNISTVGGDLTLKSYPYDPQEAKRLIKEGGWEGHEFTLLSYPRPGFPELSLVVETLAGYWQQIGLKPKIRVSEWAIWRRAWSERKTQNTIHGYDGSQSRDVSQILNQMVEKWYFKNGRSAVNIPEVNERFDRIEKSMDVAEISRLIAELYRYAYDNYLMIPICEIPIKIATTKRIPPWDTGLRRFDNNYYDLIKQQ